MQAQQEQPFSLVIFGITGDLSRKKLVPALMDLCAQNCLPENTRIVGIGRQEMQGDAFQDYLREILEAKGHNHSKEDIDRFLAMNVYCRADIMDVNSYKELASFLQQLDEKKGGCSNKLYYLAVPPNLYETIFDHLSESGLSTPCAGESWVRIAVEKPFGSDLETSRELDRKLDKLFHESQIFRIDHYLAKEAVENIIAFRFSNILFNPIWNREYIEEVRIRFFEDFGVGSRGAFYEGVGALRDVGQNHMLQMLALIGMEDPGTLCADDIRAAREAVLAHLHIPTQNELEHQTIKGQYIGYRSEENVAPDSKTDTFFRVRAGIDTDRWKGVPFILEGGKMMKEHRIDIRLRFKKAVSCMMTLPVEHQPSQNELIFTMHPEESITIQFLAKKLGFTMDIDEQQFRYHFDESRPGRKYDAYEKLLLDCINGDQTLFASSKEIENAWKFITPIVNEWEDKEPILYPDHSNGPQ